MARYFKFKSAEELAAEAGALGGWLPITSDFSSLFEPISVGKLSVGNRFCIQPMEGCDGTLEGSPDELTYRR
ncbi:MAG: NADH:flavin oxidoreductase, partial [Schlesneria sp.]